MRNAVNASKILNLESLQLGCKQWPSVRQPANRLRAVGLVRLQLCGSCGDSLAGYPQIHVVHKNTVGIEVTIGVKLEGICEFRADTAAAEGIVRDIERVAVRVDAERVEVNHVSHRIGVVLGYDVVPGPAAEALKGNRYRLPGLVHVIERAPFPLGIVRLPPAVVSARALIILDLKLDGLGSVLLALWNQEIKTIFRAEQCT